MDELGGAGEGCEIRCVPLDYGAGVAAARGGDCEGCGREEGEGVDLVTDFWGERGEKVRHFGFGMGRGEMD